MLATVDAYVNSELKSYLKGGYPTVRVFSKGKLGDKYFVGNENETFIRSFLDSVVANKPFGKRVTLIELKTSAEFEKLIKGSQVPVLVKFSASW